MLIQHFRVARHSNDLERIREFYVGLLELKEIGSFKDHEDYNGVMLGHENHSWHLEFTTSPKPPNRVSDPDDLLVFYYEEETFYNRAVKRLMDAGIEVVKAENPYWDRVGKTFLDPDGNRIVLCNKRWN
ncbi:VOC family protein [Peribacillus tepidiphilus]|uniref:VOC family protein n=1 Tax=Peribacillus tepidiphilus TaxID=2652445 RepID=UPI00129175DB|nr:VOC family protein [Peribacillus tepidiphilus]